MKRLIFFTFLICIGFHFPASASVFTLSEPQPVSFHKGSAYALGKCAYHPHEGQAWKHHESVRRGGTVWTVKTLTSSKVKQGLIEGGVSSPIFYSTSSFIGERGAIHGGEAISTTTAYAVPPKRIPPDPNDPHLEPIGTIPFAFILFLAFGYMVFFVRKKARFIGEK